MATNGWSDPQPTQEAWRRSSWLGEGIAAFAEHLCGAFTYRAVAAQMQDEKQLFPLDTLRHAFQEQDDLAAYLQAGSLVQYLYQTYGRRPLRELWREGGADFQRAYGVNASSIESAWHDWLRSTPDVRPRSVAALRRQGCSPPVTRR